ncbi:protein giant-like [Biomphalaria glabrata]|uniref:Protein giant-like n=1 Tax=Biomphalaria glabrata TaxID=6526 RepID=A0A9W2ZV40_BIOGL|nr:protein giant-like [Biomphalaria glabrata]KAI8735370.1 protein giant-like [Biomphalaria glabrata]
MTMSEGALDLSLSSYSLTNKHVALTNKHTARPMEVVSSDSGRASSDSTSSEPHEDIKPEVKPSPLGFNMPTTLAPGHPHRVSHTSPGPVAFPNSHLRDLPHLSHMMLNPTGSPPLTINPGSMDNFANQASPVNVTSVSGEDALKPSMPSERASESRAAMRPYKMYPVDPFSMYGNPLMAGASGTLSPSPVALQSLYDSMSPSGFPTFPLTPLTSHLLQRKRRAENREHTNSASSQSSAPTTTQTNSNNTNSSSSNNNPGDSSSRVSTSSPVSPREDIDSNSDGEKMKRSLSSADVKKDEAYWDRRRKNNEAAKRSRDARRQKEEEIAMRAAFLEQENLKLRAQVAILKNETAKLHYMLYNRI